MGRTVTLVLVDAAGETLGALPPFDVELPWWQEVSEVVAEARARYGVRVTVLRLLSAANAAPPGGEVTYLAQVREPVEVALKPWDDNRDPAPLRAPWAVPGGPAASLSWAAAALGRGDLVAVQQRTWNLSAIWRLEDGGGEPVAWLKQVPVLLAHEATVLRLVAAAAPGLVPAVLAAGDAGRTLLAHVPGEDRYGAGAAFCTRVAADLHPVQAHFATRTGELLAAGVPDRRLSFDRFARVAEPWLDTVDGLAELMDELPARLAAIDACGMPDTLVHGDLHPGNVREASGRRVIVDWGDAIVSHPALDILRLTADLPEPDAAALIAEWAGRWRENAPDSDPETAAALMRPVAALRSAALYQEFLDHIEDSERPYHEQDVPERLHAAVTTAAQLG
ncbi:phosphotransferase family protein [Pseudosporangium ferrugineum]|uniref:Phosphotransferase family enzyme n=1 Tax=Pseudosporangium ferrugineum TaxID=439699 RepID=A0A2T0S2I6_9ACTN|nr:aminoglycoside phosphotransferase family protein [Pseudosporangium ferrugineum]PRY27641.1 phosphotransferase family enzyme [Pseudosporangium ferrugineum]